MQITPIREIHRQYQELAAQRSHIDAIAQLAARLHLSEPEVLRIINTIPE